MFWLKLLGPDKASILGGLSCCDCCPLSCLLSLRKFKVCVARSISISDVSLGSVSEQEVNCFAETLAVGNVQSRFTELVAVVYVGSAL